MRLFDQPVLAIESSCDETSAAVVVGRKVLSNVIASQVDMHAKWGGVVPEAAARAHVEAILPVVSEALSQSGLSLPDIKGVAVTNRPGLVGALSVGVTAAKAIAFAHKLPIVGIDHLEGHLLAMLALDVQIPFPMVSLLVSGGHSELVLIRALGEYELLGETRDDAAGEAFDKGARLLGLGYPGGRQIQEQAIKGNANRYALPRALEKERYDMSFSGLKTAMLRLVQSEGESINIPDASASLQAAVCDVLIKRMSAAIEDHQPRGIGLCGGVAANSELRTRISALGQRNGLEVVIPPLELCTDNAGMIGLAAQYRLVNPPHNNLELDVSPSSALFVIRS
jgi:N6-L-threonylcarbamoyladenine synthase